MHGLKAQRLGMRNSQFHHKALYEFRIMPGHPAIHTVATSCASIVGAFSSNFLKHIMVIRPLNTVVNKSEL